MFSWFFLFSKKLVLSFLLHLPIYAIHGVYFPSKDDHIRRISKSVDDDPVLFRLFKLTSDSLRALQCSLAVAKIRFNVLGWLSVILLEHKVNKLKICLYIFNSYSNFNLHVFICIENTKRNHSNWNLLVTWKTIKIVLIIKVLNSPVIMILNFTRDLVFS